MGGAAGELRSLGAPCHAEPEPRREPEASLSALFMKTTVNLGVCVAAGRALHAESRAPPFMRGGGVAGSALHAESRAPPFMCGGVVVGSRALPFMCGDGVAGAPT